MFVEPSPAISVDAAVLFLLVLKYESTQALASLNNAGWLSDGLVMDWLLKTPSSGDSITFLSLNLLLSKYNADVFCFVGPDRLISSPNTFTRSYLYN